MSTRLSRTKAHRTTKETFLGRLLDPIDWLSEAIYSILIVLTFTLAFRLIMLNNAPDHPVSAEYSDELLLAALGATFAWGVIDGIMYALLAVFERGERHRLLRNLQAAKTDAEAVAVIADEFDYILEPITGESERLVLYQDVFEHLRDSRPRPIGLQWDDFTGALASVLVAIVAVLPSLLPFVLLREHYLLALRVSNIVSFIMLFALGYRWGQYTGANPWKIGVLLAAVGLIMVLVAIPLGG